MRRAGRELTCSREGVSHHGGYAVGTAVGAQCATWQSEESEVVVMWLAILTHNNNNGSTKPLHTKRIPRRVSPPQPDRLGPALISTQDSGDAAQGYGGSQPREARD